MSDLIDLLRATIALQDSNIEMLNQRIEQLEAENEHLAGDSLSWHSQKVELEAQCEALQNKCARRGLSPEDSDALQAENERLRAVIKSAPLPVSDDRHFWIQYGEWKGKALAAAQESDDANSD